MEGATGRELCPGERTVVVRMMCAPCLLRLKQLGKREKERDGDVPYLHTF